jgi:hypothetical protein
MKICKRCQQELDVSNFTKRGNYYNTYCKQCNREVIKERGYHLKQSYKDKKAEYRKKNKNKIKDWHKNHYQENKEKLLKQSQDRYQRNKDKVCERTKRYREKNADWYRTYKREWRRRNKLHQNIRRGLWGCLQGKQKNSKSITYIGCSIEELWQHLEKQFKEGMTRENYGEWHVDHIVPLYSFDFSGEDAEQQLLIAWNYKNLQPLWRCENLSKGKTLK